MKPQRDYYQDWLAKLRKELAISGRRTELSLHLEKQLHFSKAESELFIRNILEGLQRVDLDAVLEIDQWRAKNPVQKISTVHPELDFG